MQDRIIAITEYRAKFACALPNEAIIIKLNGGISQASLKYSNDAETQRNELKISVAKSLGSFWFNFGKSSLSAKAKMWIEQ